MLNALPGIMFMDPTPGPLDMDKETTLSSELQLIKSEITTKL